MTTKKVALSPRNSGNVSASQRSSSERRQCPQCDRKSALIAHKNLPSDVLSACRFCDYVRMKDDGWTKENGWSDDTTPTAPIKEEQS